MGDDARLAAAIDRLLRDPGLAQQLFKRDTEIDEVLLAAMERWEVLSAR